MTGAKYKLTIFTRDRRFPQDELGGRVRLEKPPPGYGATWEEAPFTYENVEPGNNTLLVASPTKSERCMYEPEAGQVEIPVSGNMPYTAYYHCTNARDAANRLRGTYRMKRQDFSKPAIINIQFIENAEFCLVGTCSASDFSGAEGFAHMVTEKGNHGGKPHRGDYMNSNLPLTAGFFQGVLHGKKPGDKGTFRFKLYLIPTESGQVIPKWGGFLSFPENIPTDIIKTEPVWWTNRPPA
jgi:hypothetical protein